MDICFTELHFELIILQDLKTSIKVYATNIYSL